MTSDAFAIAVCVNADDVLRRNLLSSPELARGSRHQLIVRRGFASASLACNSALDEAEHDVVIFVHQDVYLPADWFTDLRRCLASLDASGTNWGVLGCFGSRKGAAGGLGRVYTRGLGVHGRPLVDPEPVETLDEIVLVIRKSSGLRFDVRLPHFHLYGADLCMTARKKGLNNYAFQGLCVHNTNQLVSLPREFYACYRYVRRKWPEFLPIYTACMKISLLNEELYRKRAVDAARRILGLQPEAQKRVADPRVFLNENAYVQAATKERARLWQSPPIS